MLASPFKCLYYHTNDFSNKILRLCLYEILISSQLIKNVIVSEIIKY